MFAMASTCAVALGCIPSHRMVHEGDTYFERCYAVDFDPQVRPEQKEGCWQAWLAFYTRHQPAHRVDYALRRIEAVQNGEPSLELPGTVAAELLPQDVKTELTSLVRADAGVSRTEPRLLASTMEGDAGPVENGCSHYCGEYEAACNARCHEGSRTCLLGCESERKICLNGCY
ncbi:MAG: hypothetical protein JWN48_2670 [Myxococcaceae bacterium]|nr:hypothetical protein [Myxococcaceae bacterium]